MYNNYVELCIITYVYEVSAAVCIYIYICIYIYVMQDTVSLVSLYLSIYPSLSLYTRVCIDIDTE